MRAYVLDSLIAAAISARSHRGAAAPLRDWHQRRYEALARLFLADGPPPPTDRAESLVRGMLDSILDSAIEHAATATTPFDGYLEIPKEVYDLVESHSARVNELRAQTRAELCSLVRTILIRTHPATEGHQVTSADLLREGFDDSDEPDEYDYF